MDSPPAQESEPTRERIFVGRAAELRVLHAALEDMLAGRERIVTVAGEPGIGKTRLADQCASLASARGVRVLWGRCWEGGGAPPYWPWVQIIRHHARDLPPATLMAQLGVGINDIVQMVPELRERFPDAPVVTMDPEQARFRLFDSTTRFLKAAADHQPLLLIFDDLHAADQPSLLLLHFLARELRDARIFVLGAYRDLEVRRSAALASLIGRLAREGERISLTGLSEADVGSFIAQTYAGVVSTAVTDAVHAATAGNPFFVDEVAHLLASHGSWPPPTDVEHLQVPDGVRDVIRRRIEPLGDEVHGILAVAAIIGREFDIGVLGRLTRTTQALPLLDDPTS